MLKDKEESSSYNHYLLKVVEVNGDSIGVSPNSYMYNGIVKKLDPKDGFYNFWYAIHKNQLQDFEESGELRKIIREYARHSGFERQVEYPLPTDSLVSTD